jgi:hypothetical protein
MTVPVGCDADLYLYDDLAGTDGNPTIVASSTNPTPGASETIIRPPVPPYGATVSTYYLDAELVSGSGTMSISEIIITPAKVSRFTADLRAGRPRLRWEVAQRGDLAGFNVYCSRSPHGPWERCNRALVTASGSAVDYELPRMLPRDAAYFRLESVDLRGGATDHGFVRAATHR